MIEGEASHSNGISVTVVASRRTPGTRALLTSLVLLGVVIAAVTVRYDPPRAVPADASAGRFSAERAWPHLVALVGDGAPRPVGSDENARAGDLLVGHFRTLGLDVQVQETQVETWVGPRPVRNVMARLAGSAGGPAVALAAHYDSVPEGPGVSDDGIAVAAIMEIAAMLAAAPPPARDVIFLVTDGEEAGLLGARAFTAEHPWANEIGVVVNLEARGTSGPSLMFQTGVDDLWIARIMARHMQRPVTGSLFSEVYRRLPNDTDFTVFLEHGLTGCNFAFVGDVRNYHTPRDDLAHARPECLQHHGQNALSLVRAFADADLDDPPAGRAVYFDVLATRIVWWPASWTLPLVGLGLLLLAAAAMIAARLGAVTRRSIIVAGILQAAAFAVIVLTGGALNLALPMPSPWPELPGATAAAFWALAQIVLSAGLWRLGPRLGPWAWSLAGWGWMTVMAIVVGALVPAVSYLYVAPLLVAGPALLVAAGWARRRPDDSARLAAMAGILALALVWFPLERHFYDALGFGPALFLAARIAVILLLLSPLTVTCDAHGRRGVLIASVIVFALSLLLVLI